MKAFTSLLGASIGTHAADPLALATLPLMATLVLQIGPGPLGLLMAAQSAAWLLVSLPAGTWVDRYPRRTLLVVALAAGLLVMLFPEGLRSAAVLGTPALKGVDFAQAVGIEAVLTFFLVTVIFGTAVDGRAPKIGGLAIGLTITLDILAGGTLTGAAMNPARAFGPALLSGHWADHLVYWIGPIVGSVVASLLYHYLFIEEKALAEV